MMYDVTEDRNVKVMVVTNSNGVISGETSIAVIDNIALVQNADRVNVDKLYAYVDGQYTGYNAVKLDMFVDEEGVQLPEGTVIQFNTNAKGEIDKFSVLLNVNDKEDEFSKDLDKDTTIVYGQVSRKFGAASINVTVSGANELNYSVANARVYSFDSNKAENKIKVVTANEIQRYDDADASRVFMKIYKDVVTEVVIVR